LRLGRTNEQLVATVRLLRKESKTAGGGPWLAVAEALARSRRMRVAVNVSKVGRHTEADDAVVVPGKVLGAGEIDHPVKVAAFDFSEEGKRKIEAAGGSCLTIEQLVRENPKGLCVKIIG